MMTKRWLWAGFSTRGTPAIRRTIRRHPVILVVLAVAALGQTGCQSGPFCGSCAGFGNSVRGLSERVFRPFHSGVSAGCCGGSQLGVEAAPLPYGSPAVVAPSGVGSGTTVVPSGPIDSLSPIPDAIPKAEPGPASNGEAAPSQGAKSQTGKTNYEAMRPRFNNGQGRSNALARTPVASPEPTSRSAQGPAASPSAPINPLDDIPPLDLPLDLTRSETTPPTAPAAEPEVRPLANAKPAATAETLADVAARSQGRPPGEVTVAPGIRRIAGVESKLAGGSLPAVTGLDWLSEKGYKTILDLREESDISPGFISEVSRRGMRYIALPITAKTVDADHVSRFNFEISLAEARPLFFCDTDGTRAGVMWYIHKITVDKVDPLVARREAEELGLTDNAFWLAANAYLNSLKPAVPEPPAPAPAPPIGNAKPVTPGGATNNSPPAPSAGPPPAAALDPKSGGDQAAWKPIAAIVVTGLGVPLAYLNRSSLPFGLRTLARASLPGPGRSPKALPDGSDG